MIDINLLPWRDEQRKKDKKSFLIALTLSIALTFVILVFIHFTLAKKVKNQERRNKILQTEINRITNQIVKLDKVKDKEKILSQQIQTLHGLEEDQYLSVKLLNEINKIVPKGIFLQAIRKAKNKLSIQGNATSNIIVSHFIKSLKGSSFILNPILHEAATNKTDHGVIINFLITAELKTATPITTTQSQKK